MRAVQLQLFDVTEPPIKPNGEPAKWVIVSAYSGIQSEMSFETLDEAEEYARSLIPARPGCDIFSTMLL